MKTTSSRETASIWFWFFSRYGGIREFFKRKIWKSEYFWHDSFGKYLNRWRRQ